MIKQKVVAGDTFPITYTHKSNGVVANLPEGYDYMIGLRKEGEDAVTVFSYQNGDIKNPETGIYRIVEMVIYSRDASVVHHCSEPVVLEVIQSFMNEHLDHE